MEYKDSLVFKSSQKIKKSDNKTSKESILPIPTISRVPDKSNKNIDKNSQKFEKYNIRRRDLYSSTLTNEQVIENTIVLDNINVQNNSMDLFQASEKVKFKDNAA